MGEKEAARNSLKADFYFWLQTFALVLTGLILTFTFVGRIIGVEGSSMCPTLHEGDVLLLQSMGYRPRQGDVVVLTKPFDTVTGPIVKRVVALGGQTVDIDYVIGTVSVDGAALDEPYLNESMRVPYYERIDHITVPEGSIFVMGDNRNHSDDSRNVLLGTVDTRLVMGRVLFVLIPGAGGQFGPIH